MIEESIFENTSQEDDFDISNIFTFGKIIQIPVDAIIEANTKASTAILSFLKNFAFEPGNNPERPFDVGKPKMLTFSYRYNNNGVEQRMLVKIPILSLVTIPLLKINKAKFDMGINVLNHVTIFSDSPLIAEDTTKQINTETLVMLGPLERKRLSKENKDHENFEYSSTIKTNMQASIEIESADLPAGILQMLNLMQEVTTGNTKDLSQLKANKKNIHFSATNKKVSVVVELSKNGKPLKGEIINAKVISDTDIDLSNTFSKPIKISEGFTVGVPSLGEASALTNNKGVVKFTFTSDMGILGSENNGFIYFTSPRISKIKTYYRLT